MFNSSFDVKKHYSDNIKKYVKSRLDYFHSPNFIVISGSIATGKSTLIAELTKHEHYNLIERGKDFCEMVKGETTDTLCIDLVDSYELENVLRYLVSMKNKVIITTISYDYLVQTRNWAPFIEAQMTKLKMRNAPVHLKLTRENIVAESIF